MSGDPDGDDFLRQAAPFRRELLAHCYRMLGSVHDAEDLVQETYLRAWRSYDRFEGRSSLRTWLHRIASNACLDALESRNRRPLPTGLGGPADPGDALVRRPEVPWLEPVPDALAGVPAGVGARVPAGAAPADPAAVVTSRESVRLAFVAALQHLPPRQRAVLILRDVLSWRAAEAAETLGTTTAAVNSALQRARERLGQVAPSEGGTTEPDEPDERELLDRYVAAFQAKDVPAIVELLTAEAVWEMPPFTAWYRGRAAVARHLATRCPAGPGDLRLLPVGANGQPGFAMYLRDDGGYRPFGIQVLTPTASGVAHVAVFFGLRLFTTFGLPPRLPATPPVSPPRSAPPSPVTAGR
ncbi:sigma-70 family RNA polymerase sigma factor [Streptosporangium sp. NPDC004379]|uniref:sigma-70 family RNA polymerase sigma factor n=1 Tax=Streptosporangium sp. NPDC004379 TaxID=3366189 RepID=UPI00367FED96